ncbi:MAG: tail fiber domain-containing protein [Chitinophagaceae bacterium]|nr:tail fiber domain-containing protein [Chitinophagaceae bacterium]
MKKVIIYLFITSCHFSTNAQNVGIGTNAPKARLHVSDSSVVFTGGPHDLLGEAKNPPVSGSGTRMMWYPDKAAFRVGAVVSDNWDKDSIGDYSFASGNNTKAIGILSTSLGYGTTASGLYSTSMGIGTIASGEASTSMGYYTNASGRHSTSMGRETNASGLYSTSMGFRTTASGWYSISMGDQATAAADYSLSIGLRSVSSGSGSVSMGYEAIASGQHSASIGFSTIAKAYGSFTVGMSNDNTDAPSLGDPVSTDRIFQIGNGGFTSFSRSNALTVLRNGNIGIGTVTPSVPLSFASSFGTKISLYHGSYGDVGIGVYGGELRLQNDIPNGKVSMGVIETTGSYTELAKAERNGAYAFSIFGTLWVNGATYASDERFKQNIETISSPLQKIQQINGVVYEMRVGEFPQYHFMPGRQIGLLAQNVEKVIPEAINEKDGYKGVDYAKLVPLLIEGIKEQQQQIDELKKLVEQLLKK